MSGGQVEIGNRKKLLENGQQLDSRIPKLPLEEMQRIREQHKRDHLRGERKREELRAEDRRCEVTLELER